MPMLRMNRHSVGLQTFGARLARSGGPDLARQRRSWRATPPALERLVYEPGTDAVRLVSDKLAGPTAGRPEQKIHAQPGRPCDALVPPSRLGCSWPHARADRPRSSALFEAPTATPAAKAPRFAPPQSTSTTPHHPASLRRALSLAGTPAWSALAPSGTPPSWRYMHSAIYDPVRDRMVVFGGSSLNDVWAHFTVPQGAHVSLVIYDVAGRMVRDLVDGSLPAGRHSAAWDRRDRSGRAVPAGLYLVRLAAPGALVVSKAVVLEARSR